MQSRTGFTVVDLLVGICLITLLMMMLLPALQRVHASYSADAGAGAFFEAMEKSGLANALLEQDIGSDYDIPKSGPAEECWLVLYDPNCDHQVVVFKTQVPGPGDG